MCTWCIEDYINVFLCIPIKFQINYDKPEFFKQLLLIIDFDDILLFH